VDWESFPADRKTMLEIAAGDPFLALDQMRERCAWLLTPEVIIDPESWGVDRWLIADADARDVFLAALREAGRQGVDGYAWDRLALDTPWPFSAGDVDVETFIWNGDQDPELGQDHFKYLAATIPGAHATVWPGDGHVALLRRDHWGEVLTTMRAH
jgi:pimeloyl-ACP methyl ester carboxylesterase